MIPVDFVLQLRPHSLHLLPQPCHFLVPALGIFKLVVLCSACMFYLLYLTFDYLLGIAAFYADLHLVSHIGNVLLEFSHALRPLLFVLAD